MTPIRSFAFGAEAKSFRSPRSKTYLRSDAFERAPRKSRKQPDRDLSPCCFDLTQVLFQDDADAVRLTPTKRSTPREPQAPVKAVHVKDLSDLEQIDIDFTRKLMPNEHV